jgi:membrane-bound serine protease (ClpP class)
MPRPFLWISLALSAAGLVLWVGGAWAETSGKVVEIVQVKGFIDPPTAAYISDRIDATQSSQLDEAIIVELDSDGGLVSSIPALVNRIVQSRVPVVVWVAPRGAKAASAGALLVAAANLSYMADAATLGSALPVNLNSDLAGKKAVQRTGALIRRLSAERDRTATPLIKLLGQDESMTSADAAAQGAIDGVASSLAELLRAMDGRSVAVSDGRRKMETWDQGDQQPSVGFRFQEMNLWSRLLHAVMTPEIAFLLLLAGAFGLIFETYNPGIGLGAIIGLCSLSLSFYALNNLPTNWPGVLVVMVAVGLLVVDVQLSGFGAWSAAGIAALVLGGSLLFSGAPTPAHLAPWVIMVGVALSLLFFVSVMTAALRVRLRRPITGEDAIVGTTGQARTDIAPEGTVFTKGTLWRARTMETGIAAGSQVQIKATEGLTLLVEPVASHEDQEADIIPRAPDKATSPGRDEG